MNRTEMTREEAINYAEAMKAKAQARIEFYRRGHAHAPEVCYSDFAFLSAAISALREQEERRWIPVTERLPETGVEVLARCCYNESWKTLVCYTSKRNAGEWYTNVAGQWVQVTHWMPLPELPKEDEK